MENYLYEIFGEMDRLSPGSDETSIKAMDMYHGDKGAIEILDMGCGRGADTFLLAQVFPSAKIRAIDINAPYIEHIESRAQKEGLSERIKADCMSMDDMPFEEESVDLIWAQGSIYAIGFSRGLRLWKKYLKPGGYLICSEVVWLTGNPSSESVEFWEEEYPEIDTMDNKLERIREAGYTYENSFLVKKTDWGQNFYKPLMERIRRIKPDYAGNESAMEAIGMIEREADFYNAHSDEYGYAFFSMRKA